MTFNAWDIVRVPFPYIEQPVNKYRPALLIAADDLEETHGLLWVVMITSAKNRRWSSDLLIKDLAQAGLPAPSLIRPAKWTTIEAKGVTRLGCLDVAERPCVLHQLNIWLAPVHGNH